MDQALFSSMQNNFKKFLGKKLHPPVQKNPLPRYLPPRTSQVTEMERTSGFGKDDSAIGYKITVRDKNGNLRTKIVASPPVTS